MPDSVDVVVESVESTVVDNVDVVSESVVSVVEGDDSEVDVDPSVVVLPEVVLAVVVLPEVLVSNRALTVVLAVRLIQQVPTP